MSHLGFVPVMSHFLKMISNYKKDKPVTVLEIGVDRGQTCIPLMSNLLNMGIKFHWAGVDIRFDDLLFQQIMVMNGIDIKEMADETGVDCVYYYIIQNSLKALPGLKECKNIFDLVLIDGDHNYETVRQELSYLDDITHSHSLVICDDYSGKHMNTDNFYSDSDSHKNLETVSKNLQKEQEMGGVKAAVDQFVSDASPKWNCYSTEYDVCFLTRDLRLKFGIHPNVGAKDGFIPWHSENFNIEFYDSSRPA